MKDRYHIEFEPNESKDTEEFMEKEEALLDAVRDELERLNDKYDDADLDMEKGFIEWPKAYGHEPYASIIIVNNGFYSEREILEETSDSIEDTAEEIFEGSFTVKKMRVEGFH